MYKPKSSPTAAFLVLGSMALLTNAATAFQFPPGSSLNIDFGSSEVAPSSIFGASAAQPGAWNELINPGPLSLFDLSGSATSAQIQVLGGTTAFTGGYTPFAGNLGLLMTDNSFSFPGGAWSLTISGLTNGSYDFYYYAPTHPSVDTGELDVNGLVAPNLTGSTVGSREVQGLDWGVVSGVAVTDGTMTVTLLDGGSQYTGLSGLQIVAAPEPTSLALLALAAAGLGLRRRRPASV